jgi:outer membrane protein assembly factor BamD (BamD/ComL family)
MEAMKLYAELQVNPNSKTAYRKLAEHYRKMGLTNEADAFLELIRKKFDADGPNTHPQQLENTAPDVRLHPEP